eukprot:2512058-Amphidinium_carterae.1
MSSWCRSRTIPNSLTVRIMRYVEHKIHQQKKQIQDPQGPEFGRVSPVCIAQSGRLAVQKQLLHS